MRPVSMVASATAALAFLVSTALAGPMSPDDVKIVDGVLEKSLTGQPGDPAKGRQWAKNRRLGNCLACHVNSDMKEEQFHGEVGPTLDGVADRYDIPTLRAMLVNSKAVFGDETIMPAFYRATGFFRNADKFKGKTILTAQQVEDVLAYLVTLKD
ncbi:MAG: sulfur oxidation c-type cytochrome SoxX [Pseudomonadota bacterium]